MTSGLGSGQGPTTAAAPATESLQERTRALDQMLTYATARLHSCTVSWLANLAPCLGRPERARNCVSGMSLVGAATSQAACRHSGGGE